MKLPFRKQTQPYSPAWIFTRTCPDCRIAVAYDERDLSGTWMRRTRSYEYELTCPQCGGLAGVSKDQVPVSIEKLVWNAHDSVFPFDPQRGPLFSSFIGGRKTDK